MRYLCYFLLYFGVSYSCATLFPQSQLEKFKRVRYLVYTKENQMNFADIRDIDFHANVTTVFIIHGFFTISLEDSYNLKDDLFKYDPDVGCVIVVSWLDYSTYSDASNFNARSDNYHKIAKIHVPILARDIKEKLIYIHKKGAGKIELIGHDIGAHAAGVAGRSFKLNTKNEIHKIVGLDPAGPFFDKNRERALNQSDAKNVTIFHTNTDRYGFKRKIGSNDVFVNGGKTQPKCKSKLRNDICSHRYVWQVYSNYLRDKHSVNQRVERVRSHRYVLCVDVSQSMDENSRLIRAISSAKNLISKMSVGSYMGIVIFSDDAETTHDIIQIKGDMERKSLISKLPQGTIGATSIGAGLNVSMHMLRALPESDKFCSTIVLLSDGIQNTGLSPENVLPQLQEACIGVNSVALGAQASDDLEKISSKTDGQVIYVMEHEKSQDIADTDQAFSFSYENEIDADIRPIYLPSKRVTLNNDKNMVSFVIDKTIGKDTEFDLISDGIESNDVTLTSPTGQIFSSASPEYTFDASRMQKKYKISLAEPGEWILHVAKSSKNKRSIRSISDAIVTVRTHQSDDKSAIRLDATVSNRILEYPKSSSQHDIERARIIISAELRIGRFPIINARVFAHIKGLNQKTISFQLRDDGSFPDELSNDGVYTASILKLPKPERYSIVVTATSNGTAKLVPQEIDYFDRELIDCNRVSCETINYFERETNVGSIKLLSKDNEDVIQPNPITDLRAVVQSENQKLISLVWTSPVNEVFDMKIERYDIRALINGQEFENAFRFNETNFVKDSLDVTNFTTQHMEKFVLHIPDEIWKFDKKLAEPGFFLQLTFAVKAVGINNVISPRSNLALVAIKDRPVVQIFEIEKRKRCKVLHKYIHPIGWIAVTYC